MSKRIIKKHTRYFLAVEGEGEQSFIKWLQQHLDKSGLFIHLDCQLLGGGGYEVMLNRAVSYSKRRKYKNASSILLVDADRAMHDKWSLDQLREAAIKRKFNVVFQHPNLEGVLLRMFPGNERLRPIATKTHTQLRQVWPNYDKPADARTLSTKFTLNDLLRVAKVDAELNVLLSMIGLSNG